MRFPRLFLFFLALVPVFGQQPLATKWTLPLELKSKAIWSIDTLADGRIGLGFDGGLVVGLPGEQWETVPAPMGSIVRGIREGHGKTLVVGHGFVAFWEGPALRVLRALDSPFNSVEVVPEGWLVASNREVWLVDREGVMSSVLALDPDMGNDTRVCLYHGEVLVTGNQKQPHPWYWRGGKLVAALDFSYFRDSVIAWITEDDYLISRWGLMDKKGTWILGKDLSKEMVRAGIVGLASDEGNVLIGTLSGGLYYVDPRARKILWNTKAFGDIYCVRAVGDLIFLGTSRGVFSLAKPSQALVFPLEDQSLNGFSVTLNGLAAITSAGTVELNLSGGVVSAMDPDVYWGPVDGATAGKSYFTYGKHRVRLATRFVNGLARTETFAACAQDVSVALISEEHGSQVFPLTANSIAGVNGQFYVGTPFSGVEVVSWSGPIRSIGEGRTYVRQLAPDRALLLYWDGHLIDTSVGSLGKVPFGNPRDAALDGDRLYVLVSRSGRSPVVLAFENGAWSVVDALGLVEVGAERITVVGDRIAVGGSGGVVFLPRPLEKTSRPTLRGVQWNAPVKGDVIRLAKGSSLLGLTVPVKFAPIIPSVFQVRLGEDGPVTLSPGVKKNLEIPYGTTPLELEIEHNGLVRKELFQVVRSFPWWLSPWVIPLYFVVVAVLVFVLLQWRTRFLRERNKELEDRVAMRTEELRKALATKEEFLAGVSHEIRNPLNGVVGICGMLAEREGSPKEKVLLRTLGGCADQLRWMLDDILNFTRTDTTLMESVFDACSLVRESASMMDPNLKACVLKVPEKPCWVKGDSGKVRQVICNLISNALKYGVPHVAEIELEYERTGDGKVALRYLVRNRAPGFTQEDMTHIFDPFWRGKNAVLAPGTGLGLPVCQRLAKALHGAVGGRVFHEEVEFFLTVTLKEEAPPKVAETSAFAGGRVLGVEDEEYNRIVLDHLLKHFGFVVDWAVSGEEALRLARENEYLLILTDWRLKDMDGGQLCRMLQDMSGKQKPVVVAVTAYSSEGKRREARDAGFRGFVTKPVTVEKLERVLVDIWGSLKTPVSSPVSAPRISTVAVAQEVEQRWEAVLEAVSHKHPNLAGQVHALRSLILTVHEEEASEQLGVLEGAVERQDWASVHAVTPFVDEELQAALARMRN